MQLYVHVQYLFFDWLTKNRRYLIRKIFAANIGGFHAISGDTNNIGEMNKCWWTNKAS